MILTCLIIGLLIWAKATETRQEQKLATTEEKAHVPNVENGKDGIASALDVAAKPKVGAPEDDPGDDETDEEDSSDEEESKDGATSEEANKD
jgi:hypothetical protein